MFPTALTRNMIAYKVTFKAFMYTFTSLPLESCVRLLFCAEELKELAVETVRFENTPSIVEFIFALRDTVIFGAKNGSRLLLS